MRESIGGSMILYIVLGFFTLFIIVIASITQYGKIFRIKNAMINYLEQIEGISDTNDLSLFEERLGELSYYDEQWYVCRDDSNPKGSYYQVVLRSYFQLPFNTGFTIPIKGDTRVIESGIHHGGMDRSIFSVVGKGSYYCYCNSDNFCPDEE